MDKNDQLTLLHKRYVVDVLVSRLRDRIDRPFPDKLLHTVRGVGYVLRPPA